MATEIPTRAPRQSNGGTALLLIVSFATIVTIAAEAAFMTWGGWTLLPVIVLFIVVIAVGVVAAVGRLIDEDEIAAPHPAPKASPKSAPEPDTAARPATSAPRAALGH